MSIHCIDGFYNISIFDDTDVNEVDGLRIQNDMVTIDLSSQNRDIVLGFIYQLLNDCKKIKLLRNDDIIQFQIIDMNGTIYSPRYFYKIENYIDRVQGLLQSKSN